MIWMAKALDAAMTGLTSRWAGIVLLPLVVFLSIMVIGRSITIHSLNSALTSTATQAAAAQAALNKCRVNEKVLLHDLEVQNLAVQRLQAEGASRQAEVQRLAQAAKKSGLAADLAASRLRGLQTVGDAWARAQQVDEAFLRELR